MCVRALTCPLRLEIKIKDDALASALQASAVALPKTRKFAVFRQIWPELVRAPPSPLHHQCLQAAQVHLHLWLPLVLWRSLGHRVSSLPHVTCQRYTNSACFYPPPFSQIVQLKGVSVKGPAWEYSGYIRGPREGRGADHRAHGHGVCRYLDGQSYEGARAVTSAGAARVF
jgi:hypothetical protein